MTLSLEEKRELLNEMREDLLKYLGVQEICVETCRDKVNLPEYKKIGDAGMDVEAAEEYFIKPGETVVIPTGLIMAIPEGFEIQVRPRSGISLKRPLRIANAPGTIDSGYRDELGIILHNESEKKYDVKITVDGEKISGELIETTDYPIYSIDEEGNKSGIYYIKKGDRIAQIVLALVSKVKWKPVEKGTVKTMGINRGGGFGHTGIN